MSGKVRGRVGKRVRGVGVLDREREGGWRGVRDARRGIDGWRDERRQWD